MSRKLAAEIADAITDNGLDRAGIAKYVASVLAETRDSWGPGDKVDWRYLEHGASFGYGKTFKLFHGEHPHSRSDNNLYAEWPEAEEPIGFSGHRIRTRVDIRESNYLKSSSLSGSEIRKHCAALVYFDDKLVYGRTHREVMPLLLWCAAHLYELYEHPVRLQVGGVLNGDQPTDNQFPDLIGRAVYYRGVPGVVTRYFPEDGDVVVEACKGHEFVTPAHIALDDSERRDASVKDDFLSESIWWHRDA